MALNSEDTKISYAGTATKTYDFPITYFDRDDIHVNVEDVAGAITELTYADPLVGTGEFTIVATNGNPENGGVVTTYDEFPTTSSVVISREVPYTQQYDLQNGSTIDPDALNTALDRTVAQSQQLLDEGNRHVTHPVTDPAGLNYEAPSVTERAGKAIGYDESGDIVALSLGGEGGITAVDTSKGLGLTGGVAFAKVDNGVGGTTDFSGGDIIVKSGGISPTQLASNSVETDKILDSNVTKAKIEDLTDYTVLGNVSGGATSPAEVSIINSATMTGAAATNLSSASAIKSYVDTYAMKYSGSTAFTGTIAVGLNDLDLSTIVGTNRAFVQLSIESSSSTSRSVTVRTKGDSLVNYGSDSFAGWGVGGVVIASSVGGYVNVVTDTSGFIEIGSVAGTITNTTIKVIVYQVLQ